MVDVKALEDAIRDMDRRKVQDEVASAAKSGLDAAANIGTETPVVVLKDIRRCILDLSEMIQERERQDTQREAREIQRHMELIATLQTIAIRSQSGTSIPGKLVSRNSVGSTSGVGEKRSFYHHSTEITTGAQVVALVLIQIDAVLQKSGQLPDSEGKDAVILDLKGWSSAVLKVSAVECTVTGINGKLQLPKPTQQETINTLEIVSSTEQGRSAQFRVSDVGRLQYDCAGVMGVVEEVRQRLTRCPGILPEGRRERLAHLKHPYITRDDDLNVIMVPENYLRVGTLILDGLPKLKDAAKKVYVSEVLEKATVPILAYNKAKKIS